MSNQKPEVVKLVSPAGKIQWFSLVKTDKFGNYKCELHLNPTPEAKAFVKAIKAVGPAKAKAPIEVAEDGTIVVTMKQKAGGIRKSDNKPFLFAPPVICGKDGKPMSDEVKLQLSVGNGSDAIFQVAVSCTTVMGVTYITVKPAAVQLIKVLAYNPSPFAAIPSDEEDEQESDDSASAGFEPIKGEVDADDF